jgi:hypothetical protein
MGKYADPTKEFNLSEFSLVEFRKNFGIKIILSILCLALLNETILSLYDYYGSERFIKKIPVSLNGLRGIFFFMLINHIFYRLDVKKLTNIAERISLDIIYIILILLFRVLYAAIKNGSFNTNFSFEPQIIGILFGIFFLIFCFESLLALILYLLRHIGWPFSLKSK